MKTELQEALEYDAIAEAEKLMGESYKDNDAVTLLGMHLMHKQREKKDALLFLNQDTNATRQTIPEFFTILESMGFTKVLEVGILHVFWKPGLLLKLDTFYERVNSGSCYFK